MGTTGRAGRGRHERTPGEGRGSLIWGHKIVLGTQDRLHGLLALTHAADLFEALRAGELLLRERAEVEVAGADQISPGGQSSPLAVEKPDGRMVGLLLHRTGGCDRRSGHF